MTEQEKAERLEATVTKWTVGIWVLVLSSAVSFLLKWNNLTSAIGVVIFAWFICGVLWYFKEG